MTSSPPERTDGQRRAVLLTRPLAESRALAERLADDGIDSEIWPLTAIRPTMESVRLPPTVDGLLVTSAHGIRALASLSPRRDLPALCVGKRTAEVARGLGFSGAIAAGGDAQALAALAAGSGLRHFFHARGKDTAADLPALLRAGRQRVTEAVVYSAEETGPPPRSVAHALARGAVSLITLWSARNAAIFARRAADGQAVIAPGTSALAISSRAADPLIDAGFRKVNIASSPDAAAMMDGIRRLA